MAYSFPQIIRRALHCMEQNNPSQALQLALVGIDNLLEQDVKIFSEVSTLQYLLKVIEMAQNIRLDSTITSSDNSWDKVIKTTQHYAEQTLIGNAPSTQLTTQLGTFKEQLHSLYQTILFLDLHSNPSLKIDLRSEQQISLAVRLNEQDFRIPDAMQAQHDFLNIADDHSNPSSRLFNAAIKILLAGDFKSAIEKLTLTQKEYPEISASCYNAIGATHFYLKSYKEAIDAYILAQKHGEATERVEFNVWEACQALVNQNTTQKEKMRWKFMYEDLFPNKNYEIIL